MPTTDTNGQSSLILLHVCCADCLLRFLLASGFTLPKQAQALYTFSQAPAANRPSSLPLSRLHLYFFNPNIYPKAEYQARLKAVQKISTLLSIPLVIADYQPDNYFNLPEVQQQLKLAKSMSGRCFACQYLRLQKLKEFSQGYMTTNDYLVSTTMLASAYLAIKQIQRLGEEVFAKKFWTPVFSPAPVSIKTAGYYKQNYCGCFFSLQEKVKQKYLST